MENRAIAHLPGDGRLEAYCTRPQGAKATVIVVHEVWGLTPYIKSVCRRLSSLQIAALAPNLYSREKGLFTTLNIREAISHVWDLPLNERYDPSKVVPLLTRRRASPEALRLIRQLYSRGFRAQMLAQLLRWAEYALSDHQKVAAIGFSMGGGLAFKLASRCPLLRSSTSVCGQPPTAEELRKINVPTLTICAGRDDFMNSDISKFIREALRQKKDIVLKVYGAAEHEFFNTGDRSNYQPHNAADCWNTIASFLSATLELSV